MPDVQGAAAKQAVPAADNVAAVERELEETKQKVKEAEEKVKEAEAKVKEAEQKEEEAILAIRDPDATGVSPFLRELSPQRRQEELGRRERKVALRTAEVQRCSSLLQAHVGLLKTLFERLTLLQSQNRFGLTSGASDPYILRCHSSCAVPNATYCRNSGVLN